MSLLDRGDETVLIYPEEMVIDSDGNKLTRPSKVGVAVRAVVQPLSSIENDAGTTSKYRLRLVGWHGDQLGAQSAVEWDGKRYVIDGDPLVYNSSRRTAHVEYVMVRR